MSFMQGVWRLLGADDEAVDDGNIVEYPQPELPPPSAREKQEDEGDIIRLPEAETTTLYVVRPELDPQGEPAYSLKSYAGHLLTRQALLLDINTLAAEDVSQAIRIVDFLSGVVESVGGSVFEVTKNIFVFAPENVQIAGDPLIPVEVS